jgi:hypothetical protein
MRDDTHELRASNFTFVLFLFGRARLCSPPPPPPPPKNPAQRGTVRRSKQGSLGVFGDANMSGNVVGVESYPPLGGRAGEGGRRASYHMRW